MIGTNLRRLLKFFFSLPEKIRFILIGGFNTCFGFALFTLLYLLFNNYVQYLVILLLSTLISIAAAFIMLKIFVFQTQGNYGRELWRCYCTYMILLGINAFLLYTMVDILGVGVIISQFIITLLIVVLSYLGHKHFSFK